MKRIAQLIVGKSLYGGVVMLVALLLSSCASSKLTMSWVDDSVAGKQQIQDVLVIAVTADDTIRRLYEDSFTKTLTSDGIHAIPSYTLMHAEISPDKGAIEAVVKEAGAKSVLITRHVSTDTKQQYRPPERVPVYVDPYYSRMTGYYPLAYREAFIPGYSYSVTTVFLESNLYDAQDEKLLWSARSSSVDPKMTKSFIDDLVNVFVADLKKNGLL